MAETSGEKPRLKPNLAAAVQFLTRIPLPGRPHFDVSELGPSIVYFPLVGLGLGLILVLADRLLGLAFAPALRGGLVLVILIALTGALHLEGLIDACDGLFYPGEPEQRLKIMSDSRKGAFAVVGGASFILLEYTALVSLPAGMRVATLIIAPALGRWAMAYAVVANPTARAEGMGAAFKAHAEWKHVAIASAIVAVPTVLFLGLAGVVLLVAVWLVGLGVAAYVRSRLGGLNGDTYGTINEVCELAALALAPALVWAVGGGLLS